MHPPPACAEGLKILEKYWGEGGRGAGGQGEVRIFYFGREGGHGILKENLKFHNASIKSIFRITNLIYFKCIRNTH